MWDLLGLIFTSAGGIAGIQTLIDQCGATDPATAVAMFLAVPLIRWNRNRRKP